MDLLNKLNNGEKLLNVAKKFNLKFKTIKGERDRILFHSNRLVSSNEEYNGFIIEKIDNKWESVCVPLPAFSSKKIPKDLSNFKVFDLIEGTSINVYYSKLDGKWMVSTRRSLDLIRETFRGISYKEVLSEFEEISSHLMDFDSKFDKEKTYCYIFSCPQFHYLPKNITLISINSFNKYPQYVMKDLNLTLSEALQRKNVIIRSANQSFIIKSDYSKKRNSLLFDPLFTKNKEERKILMKKNSEKFFVEAKTFVKDKNLEYFGEYSFLIKEKHDFLEKVKEDFISFYNCRKENIPFSSKMNIDIQCLYEDLYNFISNLKGEDFLKTLEEIEPVLFYHQALKYEFK